MAVQTRTIRRRIKSVTNTRKITKAMELVAASKMRKAMQSVLGTRPYSQLAWNAITSISSKIDTNLHPLLQERKDVKRVLLLLITSDRGLAGGFNTNIIRKTLEQIRVMEDGVEIQTICIGKRGADAMRRANQSILASFTDITNNTRFEEVLPIGRMVIHEFTHGDFDRVFIAYTDFVSAITQKPIILELLPLGTPEQSQVLKNMNEMDGKNESSILSVSEYTFEPSPQEVLDRILPRLVETMIYQAVLESAASEHSSRMMAMRSSSDAASDMISDLTFTYNQARQAGITQEIAEISSGKAALES